MTVIVSDIAIFVLKRDVKHQLTNVTVNVDRVERGEHRNGTEQRGGRCGSRLQRATAVDLGASRAGRRAACHVFVGSVARTANHHQLTTAR